MKKFLLVCVALLAITVVRAQTRFGIKAGLNLSTITFPDVDPQMKAGPHLGFLIHIPVADHFALQPEVLYSSQGAVVDKDSALKLNYMNIPLLFQYVTDFGLRIQSGPQLGILVNATWTLEGRKYNETDAFTMLDFSVPVGLSYVTDRGFGVDARYNVGIRSISPDSSEPVLNRGFQFGLFYLVRAK